jgi:hypothetical protein
MLLCNYYVTHKDDHLSFVIHGIPRVSTTTCEQLHTTLVTDFRELHAECRSPLKGV